MPVPIFVTLVYLIGLGIVYPALPFQALALGASPLQVSLILVMDTAMVLLLAPLLGRWSDRIGRRRVTCLALATAPFAYLLLAYADALVWLFVARALAGISNAAVPVIQALMADRTCHRRRVWGMANVNAAFAIAFIVGPVLGREWLFGPAGDDYRAAALGGSAFAVLAFLLAVVLLHDAGRRPVQKRAVVQAPRECLTAPFCLGPMVAMAVLAFAYGSMEATLALWSARVLNWGAAEVALGFIYAGAAALFGLWVLIPLLCRYLGEESLAAGAALSMGLGLSIFFVWPSDLAIAGALMLLGAGLATSLSCLQALLSKAVPASMQGAVLGTNHSVLSVARVLGPVWGGFALSSLGTGWPYLSGTALALLALLVVVWVYRPQARAVES